MADEYNFSTVSRTSTENEEINERNEEADKKPQNDTDPRAFNFGFKAKLSNVEVLQKKLNGKVGVVFDIAKFDGIRIYEFSNGVRIISPLRHVESVKLGIE